jgi:hypothetical protein
MSATIATVDTASAISTIQIFQVTFQGLTFVLVLSGIWIAYNQFKLNRQQMKANHDWNRRSFTTAQIGSFAKDLFAIRDELDVLTSTDKKVIKSTNDKYINFSDRLNQNSPLDPDEVHSWVCERDSVGRIVPSKEGKNPPCKTSVNGEKIVNNIIKFINIYEQIGIAVKNGVYDEKIVIDTLKNPIKFNYKFYEKYIEHQIVDHQSTNYGSSFKWMYEKFWNGKTEEKRRNTDAD